MTVRLLAAYGAYPINAIVTLDAGTEAGLVAAKLADTNTTGGVTYVAPVVANQRYPARVEVDPSGNTTGIAGADGNVFRLRRANTAVIFGDSITSQNYATSATGMSVTAAGTVATVTYANHGMTAVGQEVIIHGATDSAFNGVWKVASIIDANTFTVNLDSAPSASPAGAATQVCLPSGLSNGGYFAWLNFYLGQRFQLLSNQGVGGAKTADMLARINKTLAFQAGYVFVLGGVNDLGGGVSPDTVWANLQKIYQTILNTGSHVVALTILPVGTGYGNLSSAVVNGINYVNRKIKAFCEITAGMILVDAHSAVTDPTSIAGYVLPANSADGLHPSPMGAQAIGKAGSNALQSLVPANTQLVASLKDSYALDSTSKNVASNPLFVTTGGSLGANVTGTVAGSWRVDTGGGGSQAAVASLVARADGLGNNQQAVFTQAAVNDTCTIRSFVTFANQFTNGDTLQGELELTATGFSNIKSLSVFLSIVVGGVTYTYTAFINGSGAYPQNNISGVARTPKFIVPVGAITSISMNVYAVSNGASGGVTLQVGRAQIIKS